MKNLKPKLLAGISLSLLLGFAGGFFFHAFTDSTQKSECAISMSTSQADIPHLQPKINRPITQLTLPTDPIGMATDFSFPDLGFGDLSSMHSDMPVIKDDEDASDIQVVIRVPGMTMKDLKIEVGNNDLTVQGHHQEQANSGNNFSSRNESFSRTVHLPCRVDRERAKSSITDDVLTISLPKVGHSRSTRQPVPTGEMTRI